MCEQDRQDSIDCASQTKAQSPPQYEGSPRSWGNSPALPIHSVAVENGRYKIYNINHNQQTVGQQATIELQREV